MTPPTTTHRGGIEATASYQVLGPLVATFGSSRVELGGKRQQMVLAVLLANANRVIGQDALVDAVWNDDMPERGARSLHTYVSTLRKVLHGGIERDGAGYVLHAEPERVDAMRFESMVSIARDTLEDDPVRASDLLRTGLGLWTGRPYGELGYEPALYSEANRLSGARVGALELRFEVDLLLGRHEQIVPEIEALLREEPFREQLAGMLMLALYRSGRQAEALRVYQGVRKRIVDELGIEPGEDLQDLELRILQADPSLMGPAPSIRVTELEHLPGARGYEIHERIGATEFGDRFRGFHSTMAREVCVLVIEDRVANSPQFVRQFEAEMQALAQLEHPHLAPVFDYWRDPRKAYVITPFYRAGTLESAIADKPMNLGRAIRLSDQLSAALGFLHRRGQAHGAISLGSVFLDDESNAYLTDTGLTRATRSADLDASDDVHQLGALIYQVLTLRRPDGATVISEWRSDLPSELDHAVSRALHDEPTLRYHHVEDFTRALRQSAGLDVAVVPGEKSAVTRRNPYKGLRAFQEADASDFHGRDALIEEMMEGLSSSRLLAVVGPSGSGKSSAVRAGLIPRLRNGGLSTSQEWLITDMFPGAHPFESLEAALLRVALTRPTHLHEILTSDPNGLRRVVGLLSPGKEAEIVLIIDQFEELFSMVSSVSDRQLFLDALTSAANHESSLRIILTLRADFFDLPLQYPEFAEVFRDGVITVSPPTADGLARAITQPAMNVGVSLEPGLVSRIVDDVREQPGCLPLLQFTLTDLFAGRTGDVLTVAAYDASGGVGGTLGKRAEETYSNLSAQGKEAARQLFLRLVTVDEMADDTRRRVRQRELLGLAVDRSVMSDTIQQFGALRFLSFDRDVASRAPTVELAHEALLREWPRLETWIDQRREDLLIQRRVQISVSDWEETGRDPSYLLRGGRLQQVLTWRERTDLVITAEELEFIEISIEAEEIEMAGRKALEEKAARRRKAILGVLAGGLLVAGVLGSVALDRARDAQITAAEATARDLSTAAIAAIGEDPELGVLLSLEAIDATDSEGVEIVPEAASALRTTMAATRVTGRLPTGYGAVVFNQEGSRLVTDDAGHTTLWLWEVGSGAELARWSGGGTLPLEIGNIAFAPDHSFLATTWVYVSEDLPPEGQDMEAVTIHDPDSLELELSLSGEDGAYWNPSFGADGLIAASFFGEDDSGVYVWDRETGRIVERHVSDPPISGGVFIPNTTILVLAHSGTRDTTGELIEPGRVRAIDVTTSEEVWAIPDLEIDPGPMAVSPDGSKLGLADNNLVEIWDLRSQEQLHSGQHPDPQTFTWSWDGSRLALSGNDTDVTILEEDRAWAPLTLSGHKSSVWGTAFHPNGEALASASEDGEVVIWDISETGAVGDEAVALGSNVGLFFMGPDNRLIAGRDDGGGATVDLATGEVITDLPIEASFALMPNDRFTTIAGPHSLRSDLPAVGVLVDALTGEVERTFSECLIPRAISSDDRLVVLDSLDVCNPNDTSTPSQVFDTATGEMAIDLGKRAVVKAVFSPEAFAGPGYVAVSIYGEFLEIYSLDDPRLVASYSLQELGITGLGVLTVDPLGKYLGIGTIGPNSIVIDMTAIMSGTSKMDAVLFNLEGNTANAPQFRVTSEGIGASASFDPVYRVWDINTGTLLFEIDAPGLDDLGAVQFSPDGRTLGYEAANGVIRFTPLDTDEVIARARETVTRSLTDDECRRFLHTDGCLESN